MARPVAAAAIRAEMHRLGFSPSRKGNGTGHEVWRREMDDSVAHPVLRHGTAVHPNNLRALALELERQGVVERRAFEAAVRGRSNR